MSELYLIGIDYGIDDDGYDLTTKSVWKINADHSFTLIDTKSFKAVKYEHGIRPKDIFYLTNFYKDNRHAI